MKPAGAAVLPLWLVDEEGLLDWLASRPPEQRRWLEAQRFHGERHRVVVSGHDLVDPRLIGQRRERALRSERIERVRARAHVRLDARLRRMRRQFGLSRIGATVSRR